MIIHITGPPCSGKSTLLTELRSLLGKRVVFIDTDVEDDALALKLIKNRQVVSKIKNGCWDTLVKARSQKHKQTVKKCMESKLPVIIVGLAFEYEADPEQYADHKFMIYEDSETLFKRQNLRTLNLAVQHHRALERILKSTTHPNLIRYMTTHKLKMRTPIISDFNATGMEKWYAEMKKKQYVVATAQKIRDQILKLVSV